MQSHRARGRRDERLAVRSPKERGRDSRILAAPHTGHFLPGSANQVLEAAAPEEFTCPLMVPAGKSDILWLVEECAPFSVPEFCRTLLCAVMHCCAKCNGRPDLKAYKNNALEAPVWLRTRRSGVRAEAVGIGRGNTQRTKRASGPPREMSPRSGRIISPGASLMQKAVRWTAFCIGSPEMKAGAQRKAGSLFFRRAGEQLDA